MKLDNNEVLVWWRYRQRKEGGVLDPRFESWKLEIIFARATGQVKNSKAVEEERSCVGMRSRGRKIDFGGEGRRGYTREGEGFDGGDVGHVVRKVMHNGSLGKVVQYASSAMRILHRGADTLIFSTSVTYNRLKSEFSLFLILCVCVCVWSEFLVIFMLYLRIILTPTRVHAFLECSRRSTIFLLYFLSMLNWSMLIFRFTLQVRKVILHGVYCLKGCRTCPITRPRRV